MQIYKESLVFKEVADDKTGYQLTLFQWQSSTEDDANQRNRYWQRELYFIFKYVSFRFWS